MLLKFTHPIRVAYGDTDQMGYVYYGQYARYFEIARTEALRSIGISYASMEKEGVMMPVTNFSTRYTKAAKYDDLISVQVSISEMPNRFITFDYLVTNEAREKLCEAQIRLIFVDAVTRKSIHAPLDLIAAINSTSQ